MADHIDTGAVSPDGSDAWMQRFSDAVGATKSEYRKALAERDRLRTELDAVEAARTSGNPPWPCTWQQYGEISTRATKAEVEERRLRAGLQHISEMADDDWAKGYASEVLAATEEADRG